MELAALESAEVIATTHISVLVAFGDRVIKRKVPRAFGFVDQRSLAMRQRLCEQEVALNRRLTHEVYLGVEPVIDESGAICDYVVVMRRMPRDRSLAELLTARAEVSGCVQAIARLMAAFHAGAERSPHITAAGTREAVDALWEASLSDLRTFTDAGIDPSRIDQIAGGAQRYLAGRGPLFTARCRLGLVVDGHGDLLAADIYCMSDGPQVLDCLEFDERFRFGDVLLDMAFLAMDLHWRGRPDLVDDMMRSYQEHSAEHHPASLLSFFVAYRALVRAKVACYRARSGDPAAPVEADGLLRLVESELDAAQIRLVVIGGLPGTGKTTLAEGISQRAGWVIIGTDAVRREFTGGPAPDSWGHGAYTPDLVDRVYDEVFERAATALALGESVVIDGSFHDRRRRDAARTVGRQADALTVELCCTTSASIAERRLLERDPSSLSDATPAIRAQMASAFAPWDEATLVDTTGSVDTALQRCLTAVGETISRATR